MDKVINGTDMEAQDAIESLECKNQNEDIVFLLTSLKKWFIFCLKFHFLKVKCNFSSQLREKISQNSKIDEERRKTKQKLKDNEKKCSDLEKLVKFCICTIYDHCIHFVENLIKFQVAQLKEEAKLLRTRPNQTPFNPALKDVLKDTLVF